MTRITKNEFDSIPDDVYELATTRSEKEHGLGLTALWEDGHHEDVAKLIQDAVADLTGK